jgi:exo-beta-1,3-glucanase (GH17 family)
MRSVLLWATVLLSCASHAMGDKLVYGMDYNPRRDWYTCPTVENVIEDLTLISPLTDRIRLYSFLDCNQTELVMEAMIQMDVQFNLLLGLWTTNWTSDFDDEFAAMKYVFEKYPEQVPFVEVIIVGSEAILRGEQNVSVVSQNIQTVKEYLFKIGEEDILVTFADIAANFLALPDLVEAVDLVFVNKFSFWETLNVTAALPSFFPYLEAEEVNTSSKPFMISETGWPDGGSAYYAAVPNDANAQYYFQNFVCQANALGMKYLYFSAFDDGWKQPWQMGDLQVESHWGIFNFNRTAKARVDFTCHGKTVIALPPTHAPTKPPTKAPTHAPSAPQTRATAAPTAAHTKAPTAHASIE